MQVQNMQSPRGNDVPNQFIMEGEGKRIFQSYSSTIAIVEKGKTTLDGNKWNYSRTTSKYRNLFLREDTKTTLEKIESGEYLLANLN